MDGSLVERRDETKEGEKICPLPRLSSISLTQGIRSRRSDVIVQFRVVNRKPTPSGCIRYDNYRDRVRRHEVLCEAGRDVFVQNHVHLFGHERIHAVGTRGHWETVKWGENLERQEGGRTNAGRGLGKDIYKLDRGVSQMGYDARTVEGEIYFSEVLRQLLVDLNKLSRWSGFQ